MPQTLFVSYRTITGFNPGLHKIGSVIVCCTGLNDNSRSEEFNEAIPRVRNMLATGLFLPAVPRAVVYFGRQFQDEMKAVIRELLPPSTQIVACECHRDSKQLFAMSHRLPITFVKECGGSQTMGQLVRQALGN